ncbi:hypothetical protein DSUL_60123 [Desulfovibrionales bacterium]
MLRHIGTTLRHVPGIHLDLSLEPIQYYLYRSYLPEPEIFTATYYKVSQDKAINLTANNDKTTKLFGILPI